MPLKSSLFAEFIGTFILVFAGTGAIVIHALTGEPGHIGIAITFGGVVAALIYTLGHVSGAHFNPAVTLGFWSIGEFEGRHVPYYIAAQLLGASAASLLLLLLFSSPAAGDMQKMAYLGATLPRYEAWHAFVFELILTFILMLVICGSAVHGMATKSFAGIAIGLTVAIEAMFAGPICGASMNPARSFGPAVISGNLDSLWVYLIATVLGALMASFLYRRFIHCKGKCPGSEDKVCP